MISLNLNVIPEFDRDDFFTRDLLKTDADLEEEEQQVNKRIGTKPGCKSILFPNVFPESGIALVPVLVSVRNQ